jgi:hypothetical protein
VDEYDPDEEWDATDWLGMPEGRRLFLIAEYHQRRRVSLPSLRLHAALHATVENQVALGELDVVNALKRLQNEGLGRHDAIHAIGMVLTEHLDNVLGAGGRPSAELHKPYFERLRHLTADEWLRSG